MSAIRTNQVHHESRIKNDLSTEESFSLLHLSLRASEWAIAHLRHSSSKSLQFFQGALFFAEVRARARPPRSHSQHQLKVGQFVLNLLLVRHKIGFPFTLVFGEMQMWRRPPATRKAQGSAQKCFLRPWKEILLLRRDFTSDASDNCLKNQIF